MAPKIHSIAHYDNDNDNDHKNEIPTEFICPITQEIMRDPLMCRNGQVFEREAILNWLANHNGTCPLTRQTLTVADMISHRSLKARIQSWCKINDVELEDNNTKTHVLTCLTADVEPKTSKEAEKRRKNARRFLKNILNAAST